MISPKKGLPFHEWWIEFDTTPTQKEIKELSAKIEDSLKELNSYYKDLIIGKVLKPLKIVVVQKNGFKKYMEKEGKLGGQNKLPRLSNNRAIVEKMSSLKKT